MIKIFDSFVYVKMNGLVSKLSPTSQIRLFGLVKVPMIGFVWPRIVSIDKSRSVVEIPYGFRTKNHVNSLYLGALCVGADLTAGSLTQYHLTDGGKDQLGGKGINLVFKDLQADFVKRAIGNITFTCEDGKLIETVLARDTKERLNVPVRVMATNQEKETVAKFKLTVSLKKN